jgi:6-pyruvoyltetrahydropterin/6-carboxytetrahydropterin synthase
LILVNRRYRFSASHRLHVDAFDDATNDEIFGKCNNPFGHGHNYELEVTVHGEIDPVTGRAVRLDRLDELVGRSVIDRYDHRYLNEELPEFARTVATTENLGKEIIRRLREAWPAEFPHLERIRIFETPRNIFVIGPTE